MFTKAVVLVTFSVVAMFFAECNKQSQGMLDMMLLHVSSRPSEGEIDYIKKLIKQGANVNCIDDNRELTPLLFAAYGKGDREGYNYDTPEEQKAADLKSEDEAVKIARFLISKGADLKAVDPKGSNALHLAAYGGRSHMVAALLEYNFDVNSENKAGATPLIVAAASGSLETIKLLISKGADINFVTKENATALDIALQYEHKELAAYLEGLGVKRLFNQ